MQGQFQPPFSPGPNDIFYTSSASFPAVVSQPQDKDLQNALRWAQQTGQFQHQQQTEFRELMRMLQSHAVSTKHILGGRKIDEGAFGSIETAYYHGSKVAIKYVKPNASTIGGGVPQTLHLLKLELTIVQTLRHPNIVDFIGAVVKFPLQSEKQSEWYVGTMFEFCEGGQLNKLLHTQKVKFSASEKFSMMSGLGNGLSYLHGQRVIHRDLGSRNVLLSNSRIKICDFGCSRRLQSNSNSYTSTTISGSPPWMSPEQIQGQELTLKADVFSYGTILWEMATELVPHGNLENPTLDMFKTAILTGLEPKVTLEAHMPDCPPRTVDDFNRLLILLSHQVPDLRPTAEQTRRIMTYIAQGVCKDMDMIVEGDPAALLQQLEDRMELGNKASIFYKKYNPIKLKELSKVLESFVGKEEELNEQMRLRYNADLNGEYPEIEPENQDAIATGPKAEIAALQVEAQPCQSSGDSGNPTSAGAKENKRHDENSMDIPPASPRKTSAGGSTRATPLQSKNRASILSP